MGVQVQQLQGAGTDLLYVSHADVVTNPESPHDAMEDEDDEDEENKC